MSDDIYVLNTEIQGTDRMEMMVDIYESGDDLRTQTDSNTNKQQPLQSTGSECVRMRCYRSVTVCLGLLCVLLLTAVIVLSVLINTNNQQCQNKNFTEERDQLLTKYTNLTEEKDKLIAKYNYISKLSEQWNQKINGLLTCLYDGWINFKSSLYFISSEKKSWNDSRRYCRERGADLIIINDKEEQDLFKNRSETDSIWIGLSDSDEEGTWKWVDGSTLTTSFWDKVLHKEPNGKRGENCVGSYSPGWADFPCTRTFKWICEKTLY
ncbi:CD209 antigen-like protein C isoform X1 [Misgurnus anguillicaudatus]|uniref:CD209 antigen-like protein C isoform X1 n=1 Tax=Misgurnus anguillicaudatus TaxID=75329 RepID=UPI003CCF81B6